MSAYAGVPNAYRESSVLTATPERLVVMLFDGVHRFLRQGAHAMRDGRIEQANERLARAEAIIDELLSTLDMSAGEVAEGLQGIYLFCRRYLNEARLERDADKVQRVAELLNELRDAFAQAAGG